jgi:thioredoxin-dependent peroxiredoxin
MEERKGAVTIKGNPVTLIGPEIKIGQKAPEFKLVDAEMKEVALSQSKGKVRLISVVFSLETSVCTLQTVTLEGQAANNANVVVYSISMDLPFTLGRFAKEHNVKNMKLLSDHREASFGTAYGVLVKENRLLARSVFIIDKNDIVRYVEYVKDVTQPPDYEKALEALKKLV